MHSAINEPVHVECGAGLAREPRSGHGAGRVATTMSPAACFFHKFERWLAVRVCRSDSEERLAAAGDLRNAWLRVQARQD